MASTAVVRKNSIDKATKVVLIAQNPKSGAGNKGKLVQRLANRLTESGLAVHVIQDLDQLENSVNEHTASGELRCVVSAGGDGTVSLLVNRLHRGTPFFVFPLGTANLLAKYLKTSLQIESAVQSIISGQTITMDVGKANEKLFVVVASCGYDADVVHRLHARRKGHINYATYFWPVVQSIFGYRFGAMKLIADGIELAPVKWSFVFNVPKYAVGLQFTPQADPMDSKLDWCCFSGGGFLTGLLYFFAVLFGRHQHLKSCSFGQFSKLEIVSNSGTELPLQLDGDPAGFTPVTLETVPDALTVVVDENWSP